MVGFESPPPWDNNRNDNDDSPLSSSGSVIAQGSQLLLLLLPPPVVIRARVVLVVSVVVVVVVIRAHFRISGCEKSHNRDKVCVCAKNVQVNRCVCVCTVGYQYTNRGVMIYLLRWCGGPLRREYRSDSVSMSRWFFRIYQYVRRTDEYMCTGTTPFDEVSMSIERRDEIHGVYGI